jgi:hypothetical protein
LPLFEGLCLRLAEVAYLRQDGSEQRVIEGRPKRLVTLLKKLSEYGSAPKSKPAENAGLGRYRRSP